MRKFLRLALKILTEILRKYDLPTECQKKEEIAERNSFHNVEKENKTRQKEKKQNQDHYKDPLLILPQTTISKSPVRDVMNLMDTPFLSLSKNRKKPITYESIDGTCKTRISAHSECFLASVYDWDIILFVAGKIQEILNKGLDIPPRTITILRHEILKTLHKHNVNTQQKELENSLHRLKRTAIDTTICNEDGRYKADFGFIDSWEYTERKDKKEIKITLSQWLYDLICTKGALLKVDAAYFNLTSGLKKFLYRTARKCVGRNKDDWEFSVEILYKKSGSEQEFKKFKSDLKRAVLANNIPEYSMKWALKNRQAFVIFIKSRLHELDYLAEEFEKVGTVLELKNATSKENYCSKDSI
jgi:plasmid replication initiation protein